MFEKIIIKQIPYLLGLFLSTYQCRSRKGFSAQNFLLAMFEKWKSSLIKGKRFMFYSLNFRKRLLIALKIIAKVNAYGSSLSALKLMQSYPTERKEQKSTKIVVLETKHFSITTRIYTGSDLN